ncbi:MAG: BamA/TamA family outer membrane protein [Gemmatimonadaceae bacterium]
MAPVSRIDIRRENIFDSTEANRWYARVINRWHATTREFVVRRELLLHVGSPYDSALAAESARNLRRLGFFRSVRIDTVPNALGPEVRVTTKDRWTTKGSAGARLSGGQVIFNASLAETNLAGTGVSLGFRYRTEPDRHSARLALTVPRLLRNSTDVRLQVDRLTDGDVTLGALSNPFRALSDRWAWSAEGTSLDRRVLQWRNGRSDPSDSLLRSLDMGRALLGYAWQAGPNGYLRSEATVVARREDFGAYLPNVRLPRSRFVAAGVAMEASRSRFHVTQGLRNSGIDEDVNLSPTFRAGLWASPAAWGYERSGLGAEFLLQGGTLVAGQRGFAFAQLVATGRQAAGLDSGTARGSATLIMRPTPDHLIALYAGGGLQHRPAPGMEFDLGLSTGPRAFPAHAFTGDRMYQGTAEYQWTATRDLFGWRIASLGIAAFVDRGGAWFTGSPDRSGTDVGAGLRLGSPRVPTTNGLLRIDLARRLKNDALPGRWVLAVGNGFPFEVPR